METARRKRLCLCFHGRRCRFASFADALINAVSCKAERVACKRRTQEKGKFKFMPEIPGGQYFFPRSRNVNVQFPGSNNRHQPYLKPGGQMFQDKRFLKGTPAHADGIKLNLQKLTSTKKNKTKKKLANYPSSETIDMERYLEFDFRNCARHLRHQMEHFPNPLDLLHISIWSRKSLVRGGCFKEEEKKV